MFTIHIHKFPAMAPKCILQWKGLLSVCYLPPRSIHNVENHRELQSLVLEFADWRHFSDERAMTLGASNFSWDQVGLPRCS